MGEPAGGEGEDQRVEPIDVDTERAEPRLRLKSLRVHDELQALGVNASLVGGAYESAELDAKRAIDQASRLAAEV